MREVLYKGRAKEGMDRGRYLWRRIQRRDYDVEKKNVLVVSGIANMGENCDRYYIAKTHTEKFKLSEIWYVGTYQSTLREKFV